MHNPLLHSQDKALIINNKENINNQIKQKSKKHLINNTICLQKNKKQEEKNLITDYKEKGKIEKIEIKKKKNGFSCIKCIIMNSCIQSKGKIKRLSIINDT